MRIDKVMLAAVEAASCDETRQNLCCVRIEENQTVATDGHILATVANLEPVNGTGPIQLSPDTVREVIRAIPKRKRHELPTELTIDRVPEVPGRLSIAVGEETKLSRDEHAGQFPDYSQVMPKDQVTFRVAFDFDLLERLATIARAANDKGEKDVHLVFEFFDEPAKTLSDGACSPIRVSATTASRFSGLLMPLRAPKKTG